MKTFKITVELYQYNELSEAAKKLAVWCAKNDFNDMRTIEEMKAGDFFDDAATIDTIEANEYYFYSSGATAETLTYTGTQPKSGKTFYIHDKKEHEII